MVWRGREGKALVCKCNATTIFCQPTLTWIYIVQWGASISATFFLLIQVQVAGDWSEWKTEDLIEEGGNWQLK